MRNSIGCGATPLNSSLLSPCSSLLSFLVAASAEDADAVKGAGTVSQLALKLTGKVTKKHDVAPGIHGGDCLGANTVTQNITVEEIAP